MPELILHRFARIVEAERKRYWEASSDRDIYKCERCETKVNAAWLRAHPEQACLEAEANCLRSVASAAALTAKTQEEGGP